MKDPRKYKLIVSDLDGTIFDQTYTLAAELKEAVIKARGRGCEFTFATGRLYPSAVQYARELGLKVPLITYNGALIRNPVTDETVLEVPLPRGKAGEIVKLTDGQPVMRFIFRDDIVFTDTEEVFTRPYADALGVKFVYVRRLASVLDKDPIMITLRAEPEEIKKWTAIFRDRFAGQLYLANSRPFFLDVAHPKVSKGFAVAELCRVMGISPAETIAIGDEANDVEMMERAGLGVAVGNAAAGAKRYADYVAKGEYWRGVIEVIEKFVL
ncbi:Cof-type HAD-IIB family hydrolase [Thermincola ferriacetica]